MLKLAIAQMTSGNNLDDNLAHMRELLERAVAQGAEMAVFPEMAYLMAKPEKWGPTLARYEACLATFASWAKELSIYLLPGSIRKPVDGSTQRCFNQLAVIDPQGKIQATYEKLFLFRATLPTRRYDEGQFCDPGNKIVVTQIKGVRVGLAICFDLRFPELFHALKRRGAQLVVLPSAFTATTGLAHWDTLTRARAIENALFLAAPGQVGVTGEGGETYGHSRVVAPWGEVLADRGLEPGVTVVEIDPGRIAEAEAKVDAWGCRRDDWFPGDRIG